MGYQSPNNDQIKALASQLGWPVSEELSATLAEYLAPFTAGYQWFDEQSAGQRPLFTDRSYQPPPENQHNAWLVKTSIPNQQSGVLSGKKIAIKDNIFVGGIPLTNGSGLLANFIADYDATVVTRILEAGGDIIGKSNCEYFCLSGGSGTSDNGVVVNPRKAGYSTAGSSSGSAALVAAGEVDMALGTDQGGSVRSPASWTGICGMKATRHCVPYAGGMAMETSIDYIGPMTATVANNALMLDVISDPRPNSFANKIDLPLKGLRIGVLTEGFAHPLSDSVVDECVFAAVKQFERLGAEISKVSVPMHLDGLAIWGAIVSDGFWQTLNLRGVGYNHEGPYSTALLSAMKNWQDHLPNMPINAQVLMLLGKHLEQYHGGYYVRAKNAALTLKQKYDEVLSKVDVLLMPTTVQRASAIPEPGDLPKIFAHAFNNTINTAQFNATGHPALSIPCAMRDELPVGLMLVGRYFEEDLLYQLAYSYEQAVDWQKV